MKTYDPLQTQDRIQLSIIVPTFNCRVYPDVSAFADEYVRTRLLLVYSNCNKFYLRSMIEERYLRFDEGLAFGEDRMFNLTDGKKLTSPHRGS